MQQEGNVTPGMSSGGPHLQLNCRPKVHPKYGEPVTEHRNYSASAEYVLQRSIGLSWINAASGGE